MKRIAWTISAVSFFVLAGIGWYSGLTPLACSIRAGVGALTMLVVVTVIGRVVAGILADAIVRGGRREWNEERPPQ